MKRHTKSSFRADDILLAALLGMPLLGWSAASHEKTAPAASAEDAKPLTSVPGILEHKEKQLVKEAAEAVSETKKALQALDRNNNKEALADLEVVSGKLHAVLAKDPNLKLAPIDADAELVDFTGDLNTVKSLSKKAEGLLADHQLQAARELLAGLSSEIRVSVTSLPLGAYPGAIEKTASLIVAGKTEEAKTALSEVLATLVTSTEIFPLPVLRAEEYLTQAYELEHKTDLSKEENRKHILKLADDAGTQLSMAKELGYGGKGDYDSLYQGIKALKETMQTDQFNAEWDKVKKALGELKDKVIHRSK